MTVYSEEYVDDIALQSSAPEIAALLELWEDARRSCNEELPTLSELNHETLAKHYANLMLLEEEADGGYMYLYFGSAIAAHSGFDMTGQSTQDFDGEISEYFAQCYKRAGTLQKPLYARHAAGLSVVVTIWECLIMPLKRGDNHLILLVYKTPYRFREAFLESILEASSGAILALKAIRDDDGHVIDAIILSQNEQASKVADVQSVTTVVGRSAAEIFGSIVGPAHWSYFESALSSQGSEQYDTPLSSNKAGRAYRVSIRPLANMVDVVSLTISDISDLRNDFERLREEQAHLMFVNDSLEQQASDLVALAEQLEKSRGDLSAEMERRRELEIRLRAMVDIDSLTDLYNRRAFLRFGNEHLQKARAAGHPFSMVVVDVDHFKAVNDTFGHTAGDAAIIMVAQVFAGFSADKKIAARIGGEEFAILLPNYDLSAATAIAEAMREQIAELEVKSGGREFSLTASFGVAQVEETTDTIESLFDSADQVLFEAKNAGRNRVIARRKRRLGIVEHTGSSDM